MKIVHVMLWGGYVEVHILDRMQILKHKGVRYVATSFDDYADIDIYETETGNFVGCIAD